MFNGPKTPSESVQADEEIGSTFGWEEQQHIEEECGYLTTGALVFFCCCIFS